MPDGCVINPAKYRFDVRERADQDQCDRVQKDGLPAEKLAHVPKDGFPGRTHRVPEHAVRHHQHQHPTRAQPAEGHAHDGGSWPLGRLGHWLDPFVLTTCCGSMQWTRKVPAFMARIRNSRDAAALRRLFRVIEKRGLP